jgi:hypothetical protein
MGILAISSSEYSKSDAFVPSSLIFFSLKYAPPVSSLKQQNQFHRLFLALKEMNLIM